MFQLPSGFLAFNGFLALLLGLACGAPLGGAINRGAGEETVRAWRVAHSSLVNGGVMLLAVAAVLPHIALSGGGRLAASILLSVAVYAFSFALVFGACTGHRGLQKAAAAQGNLVYYANLLGAVLSFLAVALLVYGASVSLAASLRG
ncbi:MAG TPA: hypothetical protein VFZ81_10825 [Burkholderiales bacterium]